ncbi:hypothetical protein GDO81_020484 [Engystomops pustulosus]|uniref:Uncharacterized protein n=1 Tax=Engystomops pustulosus TaxID=76066 RepID=A0AAV6YR28_ENGPU|nr:hypothetical protein GDO81_020484 [Engystomops pustulosus]
MGNGSIGGDVIWDVFATSHSHHLTDSSLLSKGHVQSHAGLESISGIIHKSLLITIKKLTQPTSLLIALWGIMDSRPAHI